MRTLLLILLVTKPSSIRPLASLFLLVLMFLGVGLSNVYRPIHFNDFRKDKKTSTNLKPKETITVSGYKISLFQNGAKCWISYAKKGGKVKELRLNLPMSLPCQFHRDDKGKLRTKNVNGSTIILIESWQPEAKPIQDVKKYCDTQIQALVIKKGKVVLGGVDKVAMCPPFQWDDYMFSSLVK